MPQPYGWLPAVTTNRSASGLGGSRDCAGPVRPRMRSPNKSSAAANFSGGEVRFRLDLRERFPGTPSSDDPDVRHISPRQIYSGSIGNVPQRGYGQSLRLSFRRCTPLRLSFLRMSSLFRGPSPPAEAPASKSVSF